MPVPPSGEQHEISSGRYRAVVTQVGASLRELTADGRPLVRGFGVEQVRPFYRGAVLAPWPNRVGDGRYRWEGQEQQLPLTEPERATALHGLAVWLPWEALERTASSVVLATRVWPQAGYPHLLDLRATCALDEEGLHWSLRAVNAGSAPAPYGCSVHPYLVAGEGRVDDWTLELAADRYLDVDPERLLPRGVEDAAGTDADLRGGRPLRGLSLDHALTAVADAPGQPGRRVATVRAADGSGVAMHWDAACPWVQVHTADRPEPEHDRVGLAVEPMTCPPDAFRTGTDLVRLEPGQAHEVRWRISAVDA
ncbi:aldose 1-epimerase family protein [Quadrisphaera sp. DSM 44207]|uniref:aldose 1-epimerase family protein n=1 Tax=Quadrisphaera sp. DSM 44207 TaxID=1881057 RepID=UPI000885FD20|nr:aldose 1-epimerase family protein [Quadrisphaera sp. DSM 44207]SDQ13091.1 aldose 1-epimerase [Quadrisphaera sp. DSM 44207]